MGQRLYFSFKEIFAYIKAAEYSPVFSSRSFISFVFIWYMNRNLFLCVVRGRDRIVWFCPFVYSAVPTLFKKKITPFTTYLKMCQKSIYHPHGGVFLSSLSVVALM